MAKVERQVKEQAAAGEKLQEETRQKQVEKQEQLRIIEEERMRREQEQQVKILKEDRIREEQLRKTEVEKKQEEEKRKLKQIEEKQTKQELELQLDETEQKEVSVSNCESQNSQRKVVSLSKKQQSSIKGKFDEENRLQEQLKLLQEQALKQKESETNLEVSKDTSLTAHNRVTNSRTPRKKYKQKSTTAGESERPSQLQGAEDMTRKEAEQAVELSKIKEQEKAKQKEQRENETGRSIFPQNCDTLPEKRTLTEPPTKGYQNRAQPHSEAMIVHLEPDVKTTLSANCTVTSKNSQSTLHDEADRHSGSNVASPGQKSNAVGCQVKNSISKESRNAWEKTVEAKRLKWMRECVSWRYV